MAEEELYYADSARLLHERTQYMYYLPTSLIWAWVSCCGCTTHTTWLQWLSAPLD